MSTFKLIALASILAIAPACGGKKNDPPKAEGSSNAGSNAGSSNAGSASAGSSNAGSANAGSDTAGSAAAGSGSAAAGSGSDATAAADPNADFITVFASHKEKKPDDPVQVQFKKYAVTKATFDPANLNGSNGFVLEGSTSGLGKSISGAGDLNGDGFADFLIGDPRLDILDGGPGRNRLFS